MQSTALASKNSRSIPRDLRAHSDWRLSPTVEQTGALGRELNSRELIARQRALVQDIHEVISLTRKLLATTRDHLDALGGDVRGFGPEATGLAREREPHARIARQHPASVG